MKWKIDTDGRSFQVWFSIPERAKIRRDARERSLSLEDYLVDMIAHSMLGAAANAIECGSSGKITPDSPPINFERIK